MKSSLLAVVLRAAVVCVVGIAVKAFEDEITINAIPTRKQIVGDIIFLVASVYPFSILRAVVKSFHKLASPLQFSMLGF